MTEQTRVRRGPITRNATGLTSAEAFVIIAITTILLTRLYLQLTGYPQVGGGDLHIAHALWGGALMMLALLIGWMVLGSGPRSLAVLLGGIGFGLFLDEVGKFVTKDNDYFYGPAAEIMYILVCLILAGARLVRAIRPLSARECLASSAAIAADGVARSLPDHRREIGMRLVEYARARGASTDDVEHVRALLVSAAHATDRGYRARRWAERLIPNVFRSPQWVPWVGWLLVAGAVLGLLFHALGIALGGYFYQDSHVSVHLAGKTPATIILMIGAALTLAMALPAMIALPRTTKLWPLRLLRTAALVFTFLSALVHFATEGFAALITLSIGLFGLAILSYQVDVATERAAPTPPTGSAE
ncbi:hypothetical protein ACQ856_24295 [Mycolicibacterium psychrotolerans]|uniref:hypothetical protein n=1 Tax=Mycolicibacterium psychrotolerans TaxID=216929 RepID=UPI003D670DDA